jgi:cyclic pyranopterin phosphate synthase
MVLRDGCGRPLLNLRLALTKRCNLRCQFCHMEGEEKPDGVPSVEMTVDEIIRIVRIAVGLGISKVKLTGGEPLVRKDILEIVKGIAKIHGLTDLSMTTNGILLAAVAKELHANGLKRVNVSLPTLNAEAYGTLTGGGLKDALEGVKAAVDAGFCPVKLNMLVLNCANDHDFSEMLSFAQETGTILQLIELEPVNVTDVYYSTNHKALDEYENLLEQKALKVETRQYMHNRRIYHLPDVKVEVIHPTENAEFCMHCTRLRVTSDGKLKTCLMRNDNLMNILTPMRNGASDHQLVELFKLTNQARQPYNKVVAYS